MSLRASTVDFNIWNIICFKSTKIIFLFFINFLPFMLLKLEQTYPILNLFELVSFIIFLAFLIFLVSIAIKIFASYLIYLFFKIFTQGKPSFFWWNIYNFSSFRISGTFLSFNSFMKKVPNFLISILLFLLNYL